jgi:hypothetical protein
MIPIRPMAGNQVRRRLVEVFEQLNDADRESMMAFAEFLAQRSSRQGGDTRPVPSPVKPKDLPRPERESVIAAVRRLSANYPMIEKSTLLHETSELVSSHVLQGRNAKSVIDDLESLFARQYQTYLNEFGN